MELIFATPVPPVEFKRRPHAFIRGLADRGHLVHLVAQVPSDDAPRDLLVDPSWSVIREACASVALVPAPKSRSLLRCLRALPSATPLRVAYCAEPGFVARIERLAREVGPDLIHVDRPRLATLLAQIPTSKVLDATDALTPYLRRVRHGGPLGERVMAAVELRTMPRYEGRMTIGYEATIVTTPAEAAALRDLGTPGPLFDVPNGVDESFLEVARDPGHGQIVFVGGMYYPPNIDAVTWFVREVLPRVQDRCPEARFDIVGAEPGTNVRRLERERGVTVTGWVEDVRPYLASAALAVAPLRIGGGFSNKLAEYLAAATPTVSTRTAAEALPGLVPGEHLLAADDASSFADRVISLLEDDERAQRLGDSGRRFVRRRHRWDAVIDRLEAVYRTATST